MCTVYGNVGYLGIPFGMMFFGTIGAAAGAILSVVAGLTHFSLGIVLATSYVKKKASALKNLFNPIIIGVLIGFILSRFDFFVPEFVHAFAMSASYLLLLVIGLSIKLEKPDKTYFKGILLRFIASPIIMAALLLMFGMLKPEYYAFVFVALTPPAFSSTLLAVNYRLDSEFASNFTSMATVAFIIIASIAGLFI